MRKIQEKIWNATFFIYLTYFGLHAFYKYYVQDLVYLSCLHLFCATSESNIRIVCCGAITFFSLHLWDQRMLLWNGKEWISKTEIITFFALDLLYITATYLLHYICVTLYWQCLSIDILIDSRYSFSFNGTDMYMHTNLYKRSHHIICIYNIIHLKQEIEKYCIEMLELTKFL